jgi:hypothetical protein
VELNAHDDHANEGDNGGNSGEDGDEHGCGPSSPAYQCPGHGRRVKGARDCFAALDPAAAPQGSGACEENGQE